MVKSPLIITVNSSFPEMEHFASALAEVGLLSRHVRPYINKGRRWERALEHLPYFGKAYVKTIGRRKLVNGLPSAFVKEQAVIIDFFMALAVRIPIKHQFVQSIYAKLLDARTLSIAQAGAEAIYDENAVVASSGVAEPVFKKIKDRGGLCVLNYSIAHHSFTKKFFIDEANREPGFADTLNYNDWQSWLVERMDNEIEIADWIIVGSSYVMDSFIKERVAKEKLVILPYGVDTNFFTPEVPSSKSNKVLRILFVGQIGQRKGISYLLRAFKRCQDPEIFLTLVGKIQGDGSSFTPWQHMFKHINHCNQIELRKIYQKNDIFLFPTLVEGMPLVILEAMASGLPVITTPNGPGDIVRDGVDGFLVPPRDVDAIVDCLERLRRDPELRIWMGRNARNRAKNFTWDIYRKKAVNLVQEWLN